jgi:hypothetical protein
MTNGGRWGVIKGESIWVQWGLLGLFLFVGDEDDELATITW